MDKSLNIKIDGLLLTDDEVRMIALLIYGLSYTETSKCLGNTYKTVRNKVSYLYQRLELEELQALLRCAHANGFDFNGHVYGQDVLLKSDRIWMKELQPRLKNEKKLPRLVF